MEQQPLRVRLAQSLEIAKCAREMVRRGIFPNFPTALRFLLASLGEL